MKKLIAIACCFALATGLLAGCRRNKTPNRADMNTNTTTTTTSQPSVTTSATQPSTIPDSGFMPDQDENSNGGLANGGQESNNNNANTEGNVGHDGERSRTDIPSITGRIR